MSNVRQSASSNESWAAWVCDKDRLERVANTLEQCFASAASSSAGQAAKLSQSVQMVARHKDLHTETRGAPSDVLEKLDDNGLVSVALTAGTHPGMLMLPSRMVDVEIYALHAPSVDESIWFAGIQLTVASGATLHVHGSDPAWVRSTFNEMKSAMTKGVPSWHFLRRAKFWPVYFLIALVAAALGWTPALSITWLYASATLLTALVLGTCLYFLSRRLLPGFELVRSGHSGRGLRLLLLAGAGFAQVAIGVFVNMITS